MKLALITDLHANREAMEAVLDHARGQGVDRWAFLGDYVGYGADPDWVVDRVREHVAAGAVAVLGNHDHGVAVADTPGMTAAARKAIAWTRSRLDEAQIAFLRLLPLHSVDGPRLFVHANAWAPAGWGYVLGRADAVRSLHATTARHTFCGHMHTPALYHLLATGKAGEFTPTAEIAIPVPPHRQWLVLPGSSGQPRDGHPAACYATFDQDRSEVCFHRVAYDHETAAAKIRRAGLPDDFADRLAHGR